MGWYGQLVRCPCQLVTSGALMMGSPILEMTKDRDVVGEETNYRKMIDDYKQRYDGLTGSERVKLMFQRDAFGQISSEVYIIGQTAFLGSIVGGFGGGFIHANNTYCDFIEANKATQFATMEHARRELQYTMMRAFHMGAFSHGVRMAFLSGSFMFVSQTLSIYRNKTDPLEFIAAGVTTGMLYKFMMGPKAMIAGGAVGCGLGAIAGTTLWLFEKITGISVIDARFWRLAFEDYRTKTAREKKLKAEREKVLDEETQERDLKLQEKANEPEKPAPTT